MEMEKTLSVGMEMTYLLSCVLCGTLPEQKIMENADLDAVHRMALRHSLEAMVYDAVAAYTAKYGTDGLKASENLFEVWKAEQLRSIRKTVQFELERERILQYFEEKGIWYLPLKGIILQQYYPKIGMRQMCDNDILFDAAFRRDLRDQMAKDGYTVYMYGLPFHDTYIKGIFNFEMHHSLYHDSEDTHTFCDYYRDVASRLLPVKEGRMERKFSDEDFYIHCISHAYKHFTSGGTGIRSVLDVFVYLRKKSDTLDFSYMERELKKLGLWEYHATMQRLATLLFSHEPSAIPHEIKKFSERDREVFLYLLDSGTYGLIEHSVEKRMKEIAGERPISFFTKLRYCFERIFPDMHCYSRHKILIPFYWSCRLFRGVFLKFGKCMGELKAVFKTKS